MSPDSDGPSRPPEPVRGRRGGARRPESAGEPKPARPPSARSLSSTPEPASEAGTEVTALTLYALDPPRTVRVLGAGGGAAAGAVPILLLGFWPPDSEEPEPEREVWAVARSLAELSSRTLESLWARSVVPKPKDMDSPPPVRPRRRPGRRGGHGGSGRRGGR